MKLLHHILIASFALFMAVAVLLTATHAKDIAGSTLNKFKIKASFVDDASMRRADDPVSKSIGDLHNHIDKTMVKNMAKSMQDNPAATLKRQDEDIEPSDIASFKTRVIQAILMWRVVYAFAAARI